MSLLLKLSTTISIKPAAVLFATKKLNHSKSAKQLPNLVSWTDQSMKNKFTKSIAGQNALKINFYSTRDPSIERQSTLLLVSIPIVPFELLVIVILTDLNEQDQCITPHVKRKIHVRRMEAPV